MTEVMHGIGQSWCHSECTVLNG